MSLTDPRERLRRHQALREGAAIGESLAGTARRLGITPNSFRTWLYTNPLADEGTPEKPLLDVAPPAPKEVHNAAFWRKKCGVITSEAERLRTIVEELTAVRGVPIDPKPWSEALPNKGGRSIGVVHTSDGHAGEVIRAGEIMGLNEYNSSVYEERMQRMFDAACTIIPRWTHDDACDGVLLTMGGDLISGDIHDELMATNDLTSHEQVALAAETYDNGIRRLLTTFSAVHVAAVPGNHGRNTKKPWAKLTGVMSYDTLIAGMVRDRWRGDKRVTWTIAQGADALVPIYGRTAMVSHGDKMGTGGGQGFAGPGLPILRGSHKVRLQAHSVGQRVDLILMGHYHTSFNFPGGLANGSVPGYSEYGNQLRAAVEPPKQWLARFSATWGLADRLDVQLTNAAPRVRIKTGAVA